MGKRRRTSLDLPEQLDGRIKQAAKAQGQTKAAWIRSCIVRALEVRLGSEIRFPSLDAKCK